MKTILLLRHAKSSWADPACEDHDRPLTPRGRRAAARMADHLRSNRIRPALVLCSSALRTRQTLDGLQPTLGSRADARVERALYGADADELLARLREVDDGIDSVMIIGHNPGLQDLAIELAGDGEPAAIAQLAEKFPTCALATLDAGAISWSELGPGRAHLTSVVLPRHLER